MISTDFKTGTYEVRRRSASDYVGGVYQPFDDVDLDVTEILAGVFTAAAHPFVTGQGPIYPTVDIPSPLVEKTPYWLISVDENHFQLAASRALALAETALEVDELEVAQTLHLSNALSITMSISPATGRDTVSEESSEETTEERLAFSEVELHGRFPGFDADIVVIDDEGWVVDNAKHWEGFGDSFYELNLSRLEIP